MSDGNHIYDGPGIGDESEASTWDHDDSEILSNNLSGSVESRHALRGHNADEALPKGNVTEERIIIASGSSAPPAQTFSEPGVAPQEAHEATALGSGTLSLMPDEHDINTRPEPVRLCDVLADIHRRFAPR